MSLQTRGMWHAAPRTPLSSCGPSIAPTAAAAAAAAAATTTTAAGTAATTAAATAAAAAAAAATRTEPRDTRRLSGQQQADARNGQRAKLCVLLGDGARQPEARREMRRHVAEIMGEIAPGGDLAG